MRSFNEEFKNPDIKFRAKPFWAWNGKLEKSELLRQIDVMRDMGFGGFFMHSRTGLNTKYLGDEWFELINECADHAKSRGLEAWLYDEDRWPSGTAGGEVTKKPENRMHFVYIYFDGEKPEYPIAEFAVKMNGDFLISYRRISDNCEDGTLLEGEKKISFGIVEMECSSFYNGQTYVDTMNKKATEEFIESTHKQYVERCGERIGDSIVGIFTDEPHRGPLLSSFGQGVASKGAQIPWTPALPNEFKKRFGYDIIDRLPEVFLRYDKKPSALKWQYIELLQELFIENFARPIDRYCREHKMILTGHVIQEDSLTAQTVMSGSMMRYYKEMEYPGIDFLGQWKRCYWIAKQLQSVARQFDKSMLLSELDGGTGWHMSLEDYKSVGDWQALYGINLRCPHLSWYTMLGQAKRDYPASILSQSPWWREYAYLEDYYARIARFEADGRPECRLLVIHPVESVWSRVYYGWSESLYAKDEEVQRLEDHFSRLFYMLVRAHVDFDYGDEGLMAECAHVENGKIYVGNASYDRVLVSGLDTIRGTTAELLKRFAESGGRLVVAGDAPEAVDCIPGAPDWNSLNIAFDDDAVAKTFADSAIDIKYSDGTNASDIICQAKRTESGELRIVLLNDNRDEEHKKVRVRVKADGNVVRCVAETGDVVPVEFTRDDEYAEFTLDFEAKTLMLISVGGEHELSLEEKYDTSGAESFTVDCDFKYELDEPNIFVLDYAQVSVNGEEMSEPMEVLRADRYVRTRFDLPFRGGQMLQPWFVGQREIPVKGHVTIKFKFDIETLPKTSLKLVMEEPWNFKTQVNGKLLENLCEDFFWADNCFHAYEVSAELLHIGCNEITLDTEYREDSNIEAIYLMGEFGVRLDGTEKFMTDVPERLKIGSITEQGFPFYSGKVTYFVPVGDKLEGKKVVLDTDKYAGSCISISGRGRNELIAWRPYTADVTGMSENGILKVTSVLTRRNTFGPLHKVTKYSSCCGPNNFETTGNDYSDEYILFDNGLMNPLKFTLYKK